MVSIFFYFHPYLGKITIVTDIFQMGWNHQPVIREKWYAFHHHKGYLEALQIASPEERIGKGLDQVAMAGETDLSSTNIWCFGDIHATQNCHFWKGSTGTIFPDPAFFVFSLSSVSNF